MIKTSTDITTNKFVRLIEDNHQEIIEYFMNDIIKNKKPRPTATWILKSCTK